MNRPLVVLVLCVRTRIWTSTGPTSFTTTGGLPRFDAVLLLIGLVANLSEDHPENRTTLGELGVVDLISDVLVDRSEASGIDLEFNKSEWRAVHRVYGSFDFYSSSFLQTCIIVFVAFFSILKHSKTPKQVSFFNPINILDIFYTNLYTGLFF